MKTLLTVLVTLSLWSFSSSAFSTNLSFLYDTPVRHITPDDWRIIEKVSDQVLSTYPNDKKASWQNPQTGNSGYLEALSNSYKNAQHCRDLKIFNRTQYGNDQSVYKFCKYPEGWKIPAGSKNHNKSKLLI